MQKQHCHQFVTMIGWEIVLEYAEKGFSVFKISAKTEMPFKKFKKLSR